MSTIIVSALWLHKYRKCVEWLPEFLLLLIGGFFFFVFFFFSLFCSREVLQEVLDTDLSNEAFPFSSHKVVIAAGHQVTALTHPLHAHTHVHDGCSTFLCFKITLSVLVKWRMQLIKNATMQIACCWVKRYFLFFFYLKGSVIKDCTLCVGGTDGVSQGVLVTSLHVESVQNLCIFFHILPFLPPSLRSTDSKQSL